jgi:hypothetical protein
VAAVKNTRNVAENDGARHSVNSTKAAFIKELNALFSEIRRELEPLKKRIAELRVSL